MFRGRPFSTLARTRAMLRRLTPVFMALLLVVSMATGCGATGASDETGPASLAALSATSATNTVPALAGQSAEYEQAPLRTVGGAAPTITGETEQAIRSQSGSLLAATSSAWNRLTRNERAILLDGYATWAAYDDVTAGDSERKAMLAPVIDLVRELDPGDEITSRYIFINDVILGLPAAKLGPALEDGERQAMIIGPDVMILVDNVVVAQIVAGATWAPDLDPGQIDDRGLIVAPGMASAGDAAETVSADPADPADPAESTEATDTATRSPKLSAAGDEIPQVSLAELPVEAEDTIYLILVGGPFPYERDGVTFGNYEERLPEADFGYYREYTVITPGAGNRGARRIVTGDDDTEFYYTDDHYESFAEVILPDE